MFGPYEHRISEAYRSIYLDIDALVEVICRWKPNAQQILEVGCGEGAVTQRLKAAYPEARITAIDITPRIGRLFRGSLEGVKFIRRSVQEITATESERYDLVVLSDVLHHVPVESRQGLLDAIRTALAPNGTFVFKDWQRSRTPIHWLCHASDRWLTGDRINFMTRSEMRERLMRAFGETSLVGEARIAPWRNNIATQVRP
jgi:2-polyprenyl-3-methyl-5-hydroxy-6-metoxy-1,4-benzoquinol methylase